MTLEEAIKMYKNIKTRMDPKEFIAMLIQEEYKEVFLDRLARGSVLALVMPYEPPARIADYSRRPEEFNWIVRVQWINTNGSRDAYDVRVHYENFIKLFSSSAELQAYVQRRGRERSSI